LAQNDVNRALQTEPSSARLICLRESLQQCKAETEAWRKEQQPRFEAKYDFMKVMTIH
jgi:hypothetical protein